MELTLQEENCPEDARRDAEKNNRKTNFELASLVRVEHGGGDARDQAARGQALAFDAELVF